MSTVALWEADSQPWTLCPQLGSPESVTVLFTDYVYFENSSSNPYLIRRIEELNKVCQAGAEGPRVALSHMPAAGPQMGLCGASWDAGVALGSVLVLVQQCWELCPAHPPQVLA